MPDNTIILNNVPGSNIIFRNFRGKPTQYTREGYRSFCFIIPNRLFRDQLAARGCNIKKLKDRATFDGVELSNGYSEFVNVAVRITPAEKVDDIWRMLDVDRIHEAHLEFAFIDYVNLGHKFTKVYLKNASFHMKDAIDEYIIDIRWPYHVTSKKVNKINAEETKMEKMTRAEVMGTLQMGVTAFEMDKNVKKEPLVVNLISAMKCAIEYIGEVPKCDSKVRTVTVKEPVFTLPEIKQVVFNDPATVVIWKDDTKTVVKCQEGDTFDKEKGLAMAICKRMMGNESNFNNALNKWVNPKPKKTEKKVANTTKKGKTSPAVVNTNKMVVITDSYIECVRKKIVKRGWDYVKTAEAAGVSQSALYRWVSPNVKSQKPKRIKRECFNKLNKALGIRWKIEE